MYTNYYKFLFILNATDKYINHDKSFVKSFIVSLYLLQNEIYMERKKTTSGRINDLVKIVMKKRTVHNFELFMKAYFTYMKNKELINSEISIGKETDNKIKKICILLEKIEEKELYERLYSGF